MLIPSPSPHLTPCHPLRSPSIARLALRLAVALAALGAGVLCAQPASPASPAGAAALPDWPQCLQRLQQQAVQGGIPASAWQRLSAGLEPNPGVLELLNHQPEFKTPIWDYMAALVDEERVQDGLQQLQTHAELLARVQARYGVPAPVVVAVWGVESNYGQSLGRLPLLQSLATLSCYGRRQGFFQRELLAALRIAHAGDVAEADLVGSWAGAFGHTQFMPTTYERLAQDFDGDGRRDLARSIPDALASTAHFLKQAGYQSGLPWGAEVIWPQGRPPWPGRKARQSAQSWHERGVRLADGRPLSALFAPETPLGLLVPQGPQGEVGPLFVVSRNFEALFAYNAAESYGLAIAHLADRLGGAGPLRTPWPTDDPGLSRAQRRALQAALAQRGHNIGAIDGLLGERSRAAIRAEQARLGHAVTGRAGLKLLRALEAEATPSPAPRP